jgi:hypothetical protein
MKLFSAKTQLEKHNRIPWLVKFLGAETLTIKITLLIMIFFLLLAILVIIIVMTIPTIILAMLITAYRYLWKLLEDTAL